MELVAWCSSQSLSIALTTCQFYNVTTFMILCSCRPVIVISTATALDPPNAPPVGGQPSKVYLGSSQKPQQERYKFV